VQKRVVHEPEGRVVLGELFVFAVGDGLGIGLEQCEIVRFCEYNICIVGGYGPIA
jgi:hypothetical protein